MKTRNGKNDRRRIRTCCEASKLALSIICLAMAGSQASADTFTWDPGLTGTGSAGNGAWSEAKWATALGDGNWSNGNDATVGGTGSIVTLDQDVSGGTLTLSGTTSSITGASKQLFFNTYNVIPKGGGTGTSETNAVTVTAMLNWANGFTLTGGGTLKVGTAYSGTIGDVVVDNGTLRLNAVNTFDGGSLTINAGGVFQAYSNGSTNVDSPVSMNGGTLWTGGDTGNKFLTASSVKLSSGQSTFRNTNSNNWLTVTNLTRQAADISTASGGGTVLFQGAGAKNITRVTAINGVATTVGSATTSGFMGGWAVTNLGSVTNGGFALYTGNTASNLTITSYDANYDPNYYVVNGTNTLALASATSNAYAASTNIADQTISSDTTLNSLVVGENAAFNAKVTLTSGGLLTRNTPRTISGTGSITSGMSTGELFLHAFGNTNLNVAITDNGATKVALIKTQGGIITLGTQNTYTGGTFINGGELKLGIADAMPVTGDVVIENGNGAKLNLNGLAQTLGALYGGGSKGGGTTLGSGRLTVGGNASGTAIYRGAITGTGGVTKTTSNIQTLSGANDYSGSTLVNEGKLFITGTGGATTVAGGAVLGMGEQNVVGRFTTSGVTLNGGTDTTNASNLAFALGGDNLTLGTAGADWSQLEVSSGLGFYIDNSLGDNIYLTLSGSGIYGSSFDTGVDHVWDDFIITGDNSGEDWQNFIQIGSVTGMNGATAGSFSVMSDANGNLDLYYAAVPEPSTWALLAGGLGLLLCWKGNPLAYRGQS